MPTSTEAAMMVTGIGKWRVTVQISRAGGQEEFMGPVIVSHLFDSVDAAIKFAWDKRLVRQRKITVEDPAGEVMSEQELAQRCAALQVGK